MLIPKMNLKALLVLPACDWELHFYPDYIVQPILCVRPSACIHRRLNLRIVVRPEASHPLPSQFLIFQFFLCGERDYFSLGASTGRRSTIAQSADSADADN